MKPSTTRRITGRHVLVALLLFFAVVVAVNGTFIYVSFATWTGVDAESAYVRGLHYNRVLEVAAAQRSLGWRTTVDIVGDADRNPILVLRFEDAAGRTLDDLGVEAVLRRPTHEGDDRSVVLAAQGDGRYRASLDRSFKGFWNLTATASSPSGQRYVVEDELWLE